MSDSQRFPVAAHALAYLAHMDASAAEKAVSSAELAASIPTNPVVVRRVMAMLAKAGLVRTRAGAAGGAWLARPAAAITLETVLRAVGGRAQLGRAPPGVAGCPVGATIPEAVAAAPRAAAAAAAERLSRISVADLLAGAPVREAAA
jgi:DNA-binding IscR family transcriptional regulator